MGAVRRKRRPLQTATWRRDRCSTSLMAAYAPDFSPYLERGIVNNLRSGSGKSRQREVAVLRHGREWLAMKTNAYRGDFEASILPYAVTDAKAPADADREISNLILLRGNSSSGAVGTSVPRPFPLRTLMVCFTIWLIATQAMIFDQVKFDERTQLLEQTTRSPGAPQMAVPSERPSHSSSGAEMQRL
jgi:hypothetical protein